jgi:hypothetical protein
MLIYPICIFCARNVAFCYNRGQREVITVSVNKQIVTVSNTLLQNIFFILYYTVGARGGAVTWGTALQTGSSRARFPMVSLEFFIDLNLPASQWPWGRFSLQQNISLG